MRSIADDCVILHDTVAGRLRLRVHGLHRNPQRCEAVAGAIARHAAVKDVTANPNSGSVLLRFDPSTSHGDLLADLGLACKKPRPAQSRRILPQLNAIALPTKLRLSPPLKGAPADEPNWHTLSFGEILTRLNANARGGLAPEEAAARLAAHCPNRLPDRKPAHALAALAHQFSGLPVIMLLGAAGFSILTGGIFDAVVTLAVIAANAGIGFSVERGSERTIIEMTKPEGHFVPVLRGGAELLVNSHDIVAGDILILRPNVIIPADARILVSDGLQLNEALLTGESHSVSKSADALTNPDCSLSERSNMVFRGAFVASGSGRAVVVATGADTEVGKLTIAGQGLQTPQTPVEQGLAKLGTQLALVSVGLCAAFFAVGYLRGRPLVSILKSAIALSVAAIPEGLPVTATFTLALGLRRLRRDGVIVRRLESVEALGSMQVICFDKTGTLTRDRMEVTALCLGDGQMLDSMNFEGSLPKHALRLAEIALLCSEVVVEDTSAGRNLNGTATETALVDAAIEMGLKPNTLKECWPLSRLQYRTDANRFMASDHRHKDNGDRLLAAKGDPLQLLRKCKWWMRGNGTLAHLDDDTRAHLLAINDNMAGRGLRVLGFAYSDAKNAHLDGNELIWVGMAGLRAPIMPGAKELLRTLHRAGIRPVMITGDQAATAEAIAREIGLTGARPVRVLDSIALARLSEDVLDAIVQQTDVFARVPPSQKLGIVQALQRTGHIVGMAGDGFNDALALKAANVAIAIGSGNASAARDVADIIVTGDDLRVIGTGIEQGRTILSNIRKSVHFIMATNLTEILVVFAESLSSRDQLETPLELLWLNLVTDILPGLGLALEPPERDIMAAPPLGRSEPIMRLEDMRHAFFEAGLMGGSVIASHSFALSRYGPGNQTRTVTFLSLVAAQLAHALTCRHDRFVSLGGHSLFGNRALNGALAGSLALQAVPFLWPGLGRALGLGPVRGADLAAAGLGGLASFGLNELLLAFRSKGYRTGTTPMGGAWPHA